MQSQSVNLERHPRSGSIVPLAVLLSLLLHLALFAHLKLLPQRSSNDGHAVVSFRLAGVAEAVTEISEPRPNESSQTPPAPANPALPEQPEQATQKRSIEAPVEQSITTARETKKIPAQPTATPDIVNTSAEVVHSVPVVSEAVSSDQISTAIKEVTETSALMVEKEAVIATPSKELQNHTEASIEPPMPPVPSSAKAQSSATEQRVITADWIQPPPPAEENEYYRARFSGEPPIAIRPPLARKKRLTGRVVLRGYLDEQAMLRQLMVWQSSSHDILDEAALEQAATWQYQPATEGGKSIGQWVTIPVVFR